MECAPVYLTTISTEGYIAPFVWTNGSPDVSKTWHPNADRFALTVLIVEILTPEQGTPRHEDGALFRQQELCCRSGPTLERAARKLQEDWPGAFALFDAAMRSRRYEDCPSPEDWIQFCFRSVQLGLVDRDRHPQDAAFHSPVDRAHQGVEDQNGPVAFSLEYAIQAHEDRQDADSHTEDDLAVHAHR
jgi:hypothetical protein